MKKNNPYTPIMLREAAGTQPKVYARYGELDTTQQSERATLQSLERPRFVCWRWVEFGREKSESLVGEFTQSTQHVCNEANLSRVIGQGDWGQSHRAGQGGRIGNQNTLVNVHILEVMYNTKNSAWG